MRGRRTQVLAVALLAAMMPASDLSFATGNIEVVAGGAIVNRKWHPNSVPVTWRFNTPTTGSPCFYTSPNNPIANLQPAAQAAFDAWENDPDATIDFTYGGTTAVRNIGWDGTNVVTWCDAAVLASNLGFIARTPTTALTAPFTVVAGGGCPAGQGPIDPPGATPPYCFPVGTYPAGTIIDGDIEYNTFSTLEQDFSTNNTIGSFDTQAVTTHEVGHFHGLSHDPVPQAVMFAFIDDVPDSDGIGGQRVLKRSDLGTNGRYYPGATYGTSYGSITGFISLDGVDADAVHVVAVDPTTMLGVAGRFSISRFQAGGSMYGPEGADFTANGPGFYRIDGLPPGSYYVYVEYFDDTDFFSGRLVNRYNTTVGNSNVSNGNPGATGQVGGWLGFIPQLAEFFNTGDTGVGGDGNDPGTATDNSDAATLVTVVAGGVTSNINIAINIEPINGELPAQRQNPTTRSLIFNDSLQVNDIITAFTFSGGTDDYYAVRFPAALLPPPPYNVAEGAWIRGGKATANMVTRLAYTDPISPAFPDLDDPVVASAGRVLTGGPNGLTAGGDFVDVRDQWNVTIPDSRDVWILLNQPESPPLIQFITEGFFGLVTCVPDPNGDCTATPRIGRTLASEDGGANWATFPADLFYTLVVEETPPVMIRNVSPAQLQQGQTSNVTINGNGFEFGATVDFGPTITVNSCNVLGQLQIQCSITVANTGETTCRAVNIEVTNPGVVFPNVARVFRVVPPNDVDCDGVTSPTDCAPLDPTLKLAPTEVQNLNVTAVGALAEISWDSQDALAGTATVYDVVAGFAASLIPNAGYASAVCAVNNDADTPFQDATAVAPGQIRYWLVRAVNACGTGTYGDCNCTIVPEPRNALDAGAPCP